MKLDSKDVSKFGLLQWFVSMFKITDYYLSYLKLTR